MTSEEFRTKYGISEEEAAAARSELSEYVRDYHRGRRRELWQKVRNFLRPQQSPTYSFRPSAAV